MKTNAQLDALSTKVGDLIHNWGFKRIHGRIWTRLFLSSRPLDAADLIEQLDISKALVSISLRELLEVKAVEEVGRSGRGTNLFRANQNLNEIYLETLKKRERDMLSETTATLKALSALEASDLNTLEVSTAQIGKLEGYLQSALTALNSYVDKNETSTAAQVTLAGSSSMTSSSADAAPKSTATSTSSASKPSTSFRSSSDLQTSEALQAHAGY